METTKNTYNFFVFDCYAVTRAQPGIDLVVYKIPKGAFKSLKPVQAICFKSVDIQSTVILAWGADDPWQPLATLMV